METSVKKSKASNKKSKKRGVWLGAAANVLNRHGISSGSLPMLSKELKVSRAAVYYYFSDLEDLVFQSYNRSCELLNEHLESAIESGDTTISTIEHFVENTLDPNAPELATLSDLAYLNEDRREHVIVQFERIKLKLENLLLAGAHKGEIDHCEASIVALTILGFIAWFPSTRNWSTSDPLNDSDLISAMTGLLKQGIANDRSEDHAIMPIDVRTALMPVTKVFDNAAIAKAKQESLLAAASWLFNLKGIDATSLDEIAARLNVTKKVIYHNVGDKEDLVAACYSRSFKLYENVSIAAQNYEGPALHAIVAANRAYAESSLSEEITPLAPVSGLERLPPDVFQEISESSDRMTDSFITLYDTGQKMGSVRQLNSRALTAINPGLFEWLPKWLDLLSQHERSIAPDVIAKLNRVGLLPR
ncbi:MAG: TetR family transcriptional regulator [Pseudomonadales bacterium]|nr:TetR family transcriptional regulator [Pseudomonadales bacterium]